MNNMNASINYKKKRFLSLSTQYGDAYGIRTRECMRERHMS